MAIVKVRLEGTKKQLYRLIDGMVNDPDVMSISQYYPNRGISKYGRIYIDYNVNDEGLHED